MWVMGKRSNMFLMYLYWHLTLRIWSRILLDLGLASQEKQSLEVPEVKTSGWLSWIHNVSSTALLDNVYFDSFVKFFWDVSNGI